MILVFDLDDTLYNEISYVHSGFRAVAEFLSHTYKVDSMETFSKFCSIEQKLGRGKVFDIVLEEMGWKSAATVRRCLSVYRAHIPNIHLNDDAHRCLTRFRKWPLYIVTDGNKMVQQMKIKALRLEPRVVRSYITHRYGRRHAKPSAYCFLKICEREGVSPREVVYIGDNPHKDFVAIKPLGFKTIRLLRGLYKSAKVRSVYEADVAVRSLNEITERFIHKLITA